MASLRTLTARAMARALLAGPPTERSLAARLQACLGRRSDWTVTLAQRCARWPAEHWWRLSPRSLGRWIEQDGGYQAAWDADERPHVRHYIQRPRATLPPPPLGLDHLALPLWPHAGALAAGLGVTPAGLWRLTRPAAWQRRVAGTRQHHRFRLLAKRNGGFRLLEVPEPHLMALQRRLHALLLARLPPHEAACGFVRGRSVQDHARAHAGQPVLLKFDLQDFFASVRASRVHAIFSTLGYGDEVARQLTALCTVATPEPVLARLRESGSLGWQQAQRHRDAHLAQGAPTSPALANLCAFNLDLRLHGLARSFDAHYTRYADDIVLSGPSSLRAAAARLEAWVGRIARDEGFVLNHRKTRIATASRCQQVCGVVVNRHPNLPRADFDRLKAQLHDCLHRGPAAANREGQAAWREHLRGRVAWAAQVNPAKAARLQRLFEQIRWPD